MRAGCKAAGGRQELEVPAAEGAEAERRREPRPHRAPQSEAAISLVSFNLNPCIHLHNVARAPWIHLQNFVLLNSPLIKFTRA